MPDNKRNKILKIARKLFLLHGYNGVSIRTIASKANLTTGAVYFYFTNKREIYKTICLEAIEVLYDKLKKDIDSRETPQQKLISTYDTFISFFYENRDHYNLLMEYKAAYNSEKDMQNDEISIKMKKLMEMMASAFQEGERKKIFRDIDPLKVSLLLATVAEGMLQYKKLGILDSIDVSDKDFRVFMTEVIGNGILKK